ncbi:glycoside hydrolase family 13 protein [Gautieria morchelliformis]|nr:glycoside hydrolase family 13 protein [Gautieria morchelliformis]
MEGVQVFVEELLDRFSDPQPSLSGMDLGVREDGQNPLMIQFFEWDSRGTEERSWWQRFELEVPRLADMGFTQAWLPPPNKAMVKDGRGYDAYDLWDLGEFTQKEDTSTRWGTKEELVQASTAARKHGIGIIIDTVLNHKLGADRTEVFPAVEVDPTNRKVPLGPAREIEGWTAFDFPGRGNKYSKFKWRKEHFTGVDWDHRTRTQGIFRVVGKGKKGWSRRVDQELGNYDFLLGIDIDHRHPEVREDLKSWGSWVLETVGSNGFRLDAIKHMDRKFLLEFIRYARGRGHHNLFVVAEYWSANYELIKPYIRALRGETSFFDVPLHHNFYQASQTGAEYDLRRILDNTILQNRPGDAVTFVDNHEQVGQSLESWVDSSFKPQAYAIILLRSGGYPCVFYGDLYPCSFHDPGVARILKILISCRQTYAHGPTTDYIGNSPDRNCVGFTRLGSEPRQGCVVLLSNAEPRSGGVEHSLTMSVGKAYANQRYRNVLGDSAEIITTPEGRGAFTCAPGQVAVWVRKSV